MSGEGRPVGALAKHLIARLVEQAGVRRSVSSVRLAGRAARRRAEKAGSGLAHELASATTWGKGKLPLRGGPPGGTLVKRGPAGEVTNYTKYDTAGNVTKRVDLTGRSHGGIPTPHTVDYVLDQNPAGELFPRGLPVRPATPEEVP